MRLFVNYISVHLEISEGSNCNILKLQNPFEEAIVLFTSINPFEIVHVVIPGLAAAIPAKKRAQSHTDRREVKEMHNSKVVAAYIRILAKTFATKTHPPRKLVALRLINPQLVSKDIITVWTLGQLRRCLRQVENTDSLSVFA